MKISDLINGCGEEYSPYMSGLVNHLPMAQLALYKMTGNTSKVEALTNAQIQRDRLDRVAEEYPRCRSLRHCLGKREMYESFLDILKKDIKDDNVEEYVAHILNRYPLCMSSGLFHTLIRLYFAVEGYKIDSKLIAEVRRASSYYVTACRKAEVFERQIQPSHIIEEMKKILDNKIIEDIRYDEATTGMRMKALYNSQEYMEKGFIMEGSKDEKVEALLSMLLPLFINSGNIVVLHCITGLQALLGLEEYYKDFDRALDIFTTSAITHLMTIEELNFDLKPREGVEFSWDYITSLGSESQNVHNIKFTYSCHELFKKYPLKNLKRAALKRIDTI